MTNTYDEYADRAAAPRTVKVELPDVSCGLAVDNGGTTTEGVYALPPEAGYVHLLVEDGNGGGAAVLLTGTDCRTVGAWLIAAAEQIEADRG